MVKDPQRARGARLGAYYPRTSPLNTKARGSLLNTQAPADVTTAELNRHPGLRIPHVFIGGSGVT